MLAEPSLWSGNDVWARRGSKMAASRSIRAVARLDFAEVLRSRWLIFAFTVYAVLAGIFVLVGMRESAVMQFTGMSRVLLSFCHALVLLLPLLALTSTGQVINQARDDGTLELLFSQPISRTGYFVAITLARYLMLVLPLALLMMGMSVYGQLAFGQAIDWGFVAESLAICAALLWAFVGLGLAVSTMVRHQAKAMIWLLLLWALAVALLDFALVGIMLQWRLNHESILLLAALNPVQAARLALLAAAEPELAWLGPVGFWMAHRVGQGALFALGVIWPCVLGCCAWVVALLRFRRGDVV